MSARTMITQWSLSVSTYDDHLVEQMGTSVQSLISLGQLHDRAWR